MSHHNQGIFNGKLCNPEFAQLNNKKSCQCFRGEYLKSEIPSQFHAIDQLM
uniref:Uncharacterized protein n=1 Tax=Tetranychus urticae TaxID=32264 RepID=T1JWR9_TETUR